MLQFQRKFFILVKEKPEAGSQKTEVKFLKSDFRLRSPFFQQELNNNTNDK